ncbi:MAG TPA: M48 family metallopeptidase [Bacteroidales bacterium]|nr:M48 family metallopeptidase [Bacteroidales bacterium]
MYNTVFIIIISIILFDFILERALSMVNTSRMDSALPEEVKDVYEPEQYKKSQEYKKINDRFAIITSTFSLLIILLMFFFGGFAIADDIAREVTGHPVLVALLFFGMLMLASDLINTPFSIYDTFVIEGKFGFNKTTPGTFIMDKLKGWLLGAVIGGGLLALFIWFYLQTKSLFWIYAWIAIAAFMIFMTMFYSTLIVPLFNKQTPLEEGELRDTIQKFCEKAGFRLQNIFVINGSKRSTKANAYFSGLGAKKRIVLFDTLIQDLSVNEIVAVLAHEIGHYKKRHVIIGIIIGIIQTGITLFIFSLLVDNLLLSKALGADQPSFHLGLIAFGILYSPISLISGVFMNIFSRKNEYEADRFTADFNCHHDLISALKKLSRKNLTNLTPHPAYVFFHYSHPTLLQRIRALKKEAKAESVLENQIKI